MKKAFLFCFLFAASCAVNAQFSKSWYIGGGGGYTNYKTPKFELYANKNMKLFNRQGEMKAGFSTRFYDLEFDKVKDLKAESVGMFADIAVYPFNKGLFAGVRWELVNFNWLTQESKSKIRSEKGYDANTLYSGTAAFFQLGYNFNLGKNVNLKLYGQPGVQQFKISNGGTTFGDYAGASNSNIIVEDHTKFIYDVNLALEFKIGNRGK